MDRALAVGVVRANRRRRWIAGVTPVAAAVLLLVLLPGWMRPSLQRSRIRTARVTSGPIDAVISASGTIVPEIERVLSSPVDARVLRVLKPRGAALAPGDAVVQLDVAEAQLALDRVNTDVRISDNQQAQARLALKTSLADLDGRIARAALDRQMLAAKVDGAQRLFAGGLVSEQALREAQLALDQVDIDLRRLRDERLNAQEATALQAEGLMLQRTALEKSAREARRVLELATTRSDRDGVLTWVLPQEGALVRKGDVIARIADLRSFRVDASVSDVHAGRIHPGTRAIVRVGAVDLEATVAEVFPTVEDGVVRFTLALAEPAHPLLRPNLRADVAIVTGHKAKVLRVRQGSFITGADTGQAFVIRGDRALRTALRIGLRGVDDVEVSGVNEGDEVIVSDMRDYQHLKEIGIQ